VNWKYAAAAVKAAYFLAGRAGWKIPPGGEITVWRRRDRRASG
jgi:hypothetical protein